MGGKLWFLMTRCRIGMAVFVGVLTLLPAAPHDDGWFRV